LADTTVGGAVELTDFGFWILDFGFWILRMCELFGFLGQVERTKQDFGFWIEYRGMVMGLILV
jgi:uncharacterized membrane protein